MCFKDLSPPLKENNNSESIIEKYMLKSMQFNCIEKIQNGEKKLKIAILMYLKRHGCSKKLFTHIISII